MRRWLAIWSVVLACGASALQAANVGWMRIEGAITRATATYVSRAVDVAAQSGDTCLIIQLDTPGGALDATKEIVEKFYASPIPIIVYVAPAGAWAGSAGCFITLAADVAAMAPSTCIGAAHPVTMGFGGGAETSTNDIMRQKLENMTGNYIGSIAERRGRNVDWAKSSVVNSQALGAAEALKTNVIDLIAKDDADLLRQLDGRVVGGKTLNTVQATLVPIPMRTREKILQVLSHPELMLVLTLVAMYGLIGELSNPGAILPGVAGAIALVLVLYMAAVLPVSTAGLVLLGLAFLLFIIDVFAPTHGVLTFGGIVAFFLGALMLFNGADPVFQLSLAYIIPSTVLTALFFLFVVGAGLRAQRLPVRAGKETMLGKTVTALGAIDAGAGKVFLEGEYWNAVSEAPLRAGETAEVVGLDGLTLRLKPKHSETRT